MCGTVEHYERGCCKSQRQTLWLMCNSATREIIGTHVKVMDRDNWTGAEEPLDQLGLGSHLHGLLVAAYCRAFPAETAKCLKLMDEAAARASALAAVALADRPPPRPPLLNTVVSL